MSGPKKHDKLALRYVDAIMASDFARREGPRILAKAKLSLEDIRPESAYISSRTYSRLLKAILHCSHDESFAFLEHGLRPGTFGLLCQAMLASPDLDSALKTCARFFGLVSSDFHLNLVSNTRQIRVELHLDRPLKGPESFFTEAAFAIMLRVSAWLIDRTIVPTAMSFAYAPDLSGHSFESKFACPISFLQPVSSVTLSRDYAAEPIKRTSEQLRKMLRNSTRNLLLDFKKDESFQSIVCAYLLQRPQHLTHGLEELAAHLMLSPSTLRRRLREEGHNFNELRENLRRQRSLYYLSCTHKSVDAIALELGYSEASTFHRAFKKWTGATPQGYRQKDQSSSAKVYRQASGPKDGRSCQPN